MSDYAKTRAQERIRAASRAGLDVTADGGGYRAAICLVLPAGLS